VLALLAHEVGHIKWHREPIYFTLACYKARFADASWATFNASAWNRWTPLGLDKLEDHRAGGPKKPRFVNSNDELKAIHKEFATALAADSPEEDFVETYKLRVLANAGLPHLWIVHSAMDKVDLLKRSSSAYPLYAAKETCVEPLVISFVHHGKGASHQRYNP